MDKFKAATQKKRNEEIFGKLQSIVDIMHREGNKADPDWNHTFDLYMKGEIGPNRLPLNLQYTAEYIGKELGFRSVNGSLTVSVDDFSCIFKLESCPHILREMKAESSRTHKPGTGITLPKGITKSRYKDVAREYNSIGPIDENLRMYQANLVESLRVERECVWTDENKSSRKHNLGLIKLWQGYVDTWTGIHNEALHIDYVDLVHEKAADSDPVIRKLRERADEYQDAYGVWMPGSRDIYNLFLEAGIQPINDEVWVFIHHAAEEIQKGHYGAAETFETHFQRLTDELKEKQEKFQVNYCNKNGSFKASLSHRKRGQMGWASKDIDQREAYLRNLAGFENDIKKVLDGAGIPV